MSDFITVAELRIEAERLCDENERLEAENAELQETLQRRTEQFEGMTEMWAKRGVENYRLRELVKRMFDRVNYECRCCSVFCSDWDKDNECCVFTTLMRELGVVA